MNAYMGGTGRVKSCKRTLCREWNFLMQNWWQANTDSWTQECKGHVLSTKTLRSHVTRDYTVFNALRPIMVEIAWYYTSWRFHPHALNHVIPRKCDLTTCILLNHICTIICMAVHFSFCLFFTTHCTCLQKNLIISQIFVDPRVH